MTSTAVTMNTYYSIFSCTWKMFLYFCDGIKWLNANEFSVLNDITQKKKTKNNNNFLFCFFIFSFLFDIKEKSMKCRNCIIMIWVNLTCGINFLVGREASSCNSNYVYYILSTVLYCIVFCPWLIWCKHFLSIEWTFVLHIILCCFPFFDSIFLEPIVRALRWLQPHLFQSIERILTSLKKLNEKKLHSMNYNCFYILAYSTA